MTAVPSTAAIVVVEPIDLCVSVDSAVVSFSGATDPAILETSLQSVPYGRFSIFACDPVDVFAIHHAGGTPRAGAWGSDLFRALADRVAAYP